MRCLGERSERPRPLPGPRPGWLIDCETLRPGEHTTGCRPSGRHDLTSEAGQYQTLNEFWHRAGWLVLEILSAAPDHSNDLLVRN